MSEEEYSFKCPRCVEEFTEFYGVRLTPKIAEQLAALSHRDSKTLICPDCGKAETIFDVCVRDKEDGDKVFLPWEPLFEIPVAEARRIERSWLDASNTL